MSERIEKLRSLLSVDKIPLCIEKARIVTESYKQTEGEPAVIRHAKAQALVCEKMPIFIEDGELIVGNGASRAAGVEALWAEGIWSMEDIAGLRNEGWSIADKDEADIRLMNEYWKPRTFAYQAGQLLDDGRLWPFVQSGVTLPPWRDKELGWGGFGGNGLGVAANLCLLTVKYEEILNKGLNRMIEEAEQELKELRFVSADAVRKAHFLKAVIIVHRGLIRFVERFAELAEEMAGKATDPARKKELKRIADTCRNVPANPPQGFYEATQSFWFTFLALNPNSTLSLGRFDQFMYPFYQKDIEEGKITEEEAIELLECLRIKDMQIAFAASRGQQREKNAGMAKWHNMTIGGQTPEGKDATNELSYLVLEAARRCPTPHYTVTARIHDGTPEKFLLKALEIVKTGIGMPALIGDKSYINYLLGQGVPLEKARNYAMAGCLDTSLPGDSRISAYCMTVVPAILDFFLHNGIEPRTGTQLGPKTGDIESFQTFEEFLTAFKQHLAYFMGLVAEYDNIFMRLKGDQWPYPLESALMTDAVKAGKDMFQREFTFENGAVLNAVGMINVADSLAAVKKLVYDDKKITMKQLKTALQTNWEGYENIRQLCLKAPKYGNDDDYVDAITADLYKFWADTAVTLDSALGGKHKPSAISISAQWPGGTVTGATPDGRFAGGVLADGTMSPMRGMDTCGPTAVIKSAMKINQDPYQATLLNMKFHPSAMKSTEDLKKLSDLIKTDFSRGGKHVQFNVVDRQTLKDAQVAPQNHRDLVVRVAGYSAYFVQLGKVIQDEVIGRTEFDKAV
jgi:pyruvate formate-lyase/glycerol dehydratase family glycyl radical enzyme